MTDDNHGSSATPIPTELVARLEAASVGSSELDDSVVIAATGGEMMDWWDEAAQQHVIKAGDGSRVNVTPVTTSLDAALALAERVLPGWVSLIAAGGDLKQTADLLGPVTGIGEDMEGNDVELREDSHGEADTPALALCIAILKATPASSVGMSEANGPKTPSPLEQA